MKPWTALATELLSPKLQELVELIGLSATMSMVERFGGLRIYIPANPPEEHPFAEVIGYANLVKLAEAIGVDGQGDRFLLPKAMRALNAVRNARIRDDYQAGKSTRTLAIEHHLTERHIERIVSGVRPTNERQTNLVW